MGNGGCRHASHVSRGQRYALRRGHMRSVWHSPLVMLIVKVDMRSMFAEVYLPILIGLGFNLNILIPFYEGIGLIPL